MIYPNLRHLHAFVETARRGSFRSAAAVLHLGQPAVSQAVAQLEAQVGARLLDRTTRTVSLTDAGRAFLPGAERVLAEVTQAFESTRERARLGLTRVRVATVSTAAFRLLPQVLGEVGRLDPRLRIVFHDASTAGIERRLDAGDDDLGLASDDVDERRFRFTPLLLDEYRVLCSATHPLARRSSIRASDLIEHGVLMVDQSSGIRRRFDRAFEGAGQTPAVHFETNQLHTLIGLVEAGMGVTAIPALSCPARLEPGLVALPLDGPPIVRVLGLVLPRGREPVAAVRFVHQIVVGLCREGRMNLPDGARPFQRGDERGALAS